MLRLARARAVTLAALLAIKRLRAATPAEDSSIDTQDRFEAMYRQNEQRLLGYALHRAPTEQAKDAVADTFLAAWRRFDDLPDEPLPWLIGATRKALAASGAHRGDRRPWPTASPVNH
jgi:DNA-directed RNA polymerase specialized sigma24 family protein